MVDTISHENGTVGSSLPRVDGVAKATGRALYADDLRLPGMQFGRTVRSDIPHGKLLAIDLDAAFDWQGVTVITAEDIPGDNLVSLIEGDQPALVPVGGTIMHCDEPVALVCAPTARRAAEAAGHVQLRTTPLPAVLNLDEALAADTVIYGEDNLQRRIELSKGDAASAMQQADIVIEGEYRTGAQEQMYIEPQGLLASWSDDQAALTVRGSMQCPYYVTAALAPLLRLEVGNITVQQATTGGGFGGKEEYPSILACHAALLAQKAHAPVKMIYERSEDIGATTKRHPSRVHHRLGLKKDGTIVAIEVDVVLDGGAYVTLTPVVISRAVLHASGPYRCDNVRVVGRSVATNTPPHGAFRGFGAPQVTFAYERQMQKAAVALGLDPFALRRKNMLREGDRTATGQLLQFSVATQEVLDAVAGAAEKPCAATGPGAQGQALRRGRGLSFYLHGAGFTGSGEARLQSKVAVAINEQGEVEVRAASTDIGQGAFTIFSQMAGAALGISPESIRVATPSTDRVPDSGPTVASRTCMVVGSIVAQAAAALRKHLEAFAEESNREPGDIAALARAYAAKHGPYEQLATYALPPGIRWDDETYQGDAYPVFGWAACLADVAIDSDTYEVTVERLVHAVDVGKAINPCIVKGQIEGGTLQAVGWALWESVQYQNGRVINRRLTDNIIPTACDAPELETIIVEKSFPHGPFGAKGVGEIPMDGPGAAVANAIADALGTELADAPPDQLPLLPEVLFALAEEGEA